MRNVEKRFSLKENGFNGSYKLSLVTTNQKTFKDFLFNHCDDRGIYFRTIQKHIMNIIIIENLNIDKEYQNKGHGSKLLREILSGYNIKHAVLACDITQGQRFGFFLEKFYELKGFKTIETYQDFPLMLYPQESAIKIMTSLN